MPGPFRSVLEGATSFFVFPAVDRGGYLEGGGQALMDSYSDILRNMHPHDPDRRAFITAIFSKGSEVTMDQAGRASLPKNLLQAAGIERDILFVGALDRFQIWDPTRFAAYEAAMSERAEQNQDALAAPFYESRGQTLPGGR